MKKVLSRKADIILFVLPALLIYMVFCLYPLVTNIYNSFQKTDLLTPSKFIGLKNYAKLLKDDSFKMAIRNVLIWMVSCYASQMCLGLFFGYILFQKVKGAQFFQAVFFLPSVISGTAIAILWKFIYHPNFGIVNGVLKFFKLDFLCRNWLADEKTAIYAIVVVCMWQYIGYHMVIHISGMKNIDPQIFEAAAIDGASKSQQFWKIMFPLLKNLLRIDSILIVTACLKAYDLVAATTGGGPSHTTETLATQMYFQGFRNLKFGYASAISVVLLACCIFFTTLVNKIFGEKEE